MINERQEQLGTILEHVASELDVPAELMQEAVAKYDALGEWIKQDNQDRLRADSDVYPQGSTRLGTMIRPVNPEDDYDIDLVYCREIAKGSVTQEELKKQTGEQLARFIQHLHGSGEEIPKLEPGRRCWTLQYPKKFHMDVLPSIPDDEAAKHNLQNVEDGILITDKKLREWKPSNPKGYAEWFDERDRVLLTERRDMMAKAASVEVEQIPIRTVRTPLRMAVQLLKRHRDFRYQGNPEDKPISIIITTLAARAYNNDTNLYQVLMSLAQNMCKEIKRRDGVYWVPNPINPDENFADKWQEQPERATRFFEWLGQVEQDIETIVGQQGLDKVTASMSPVFGESVVTKAAKRYGETLRVQRETGKLKMDDKTGVLGAAGAMPVVGHTFYGDSHTDTPA